MLVRDHKRRIAVTALTVLISSSALEAAECRSVGGHLNQQTVSARRDVTISGGMMTLKGGIVGRQAPPRTLSCVALAKGVMCERAFGPVIVTVMTNGSRMIETITDAKTGREEAGIAYECDKPLMLR